MLTRRTTLGLLAAAPLGATLAPRASLAREPEVFQNPLAINAADPVAYFIDRRPVYGIPAHTVKWNGASWRFASPENAATFAADPQAFAPVFGGYCAFAASKGYLAPTIADAWTIHENRLYLNFNLRAQELWRADIPGNIAKGLSNWPGILG